jgi:hypothetical protein
MKNIVFTITFTCISFLAQSQSIPITGDQYHLYGANSTWGQYLKIGGNGRGTTHASVVSTNGNLHLDSKDGNALYLNHYSLGNTYINPQGGFVGVGTSIPTKPLHILSSTEHHQIRIQGSNDKHTWIQFYPSGSGVLNWQTGANTSGFSIYDISNSKYRLTVANSGNVGIGTTTPERKLEIGDEATDLSAFARLDGFWSTEFERHARLEFNDKNFGIGAGRITSNGYDDDLYLWSYNGEGRDISFLSTPNGETDPSTWNHNLIIKGTNGFVGIGTTNPKSKLAVNGQIRATEVKVLADISVPDYVFEADYELRTLKETKEFVTENKHLPEIPSAAEIGENGIDLGDMNMRLLKKIEELTLYQIDLMEKLEEQQKRIEKLENK